jgi:DNA-directed RNA polymerase specialized sigma24 family protein
MEFQETAMGAPEKGVAWSPDLANDRIGVARYLIERQDLIRAAARRKLSSHTRSVFDSEDVLSSVLRRVDSMVTEGRLRPRSEAELWALVNTIAANNAMNRSRLIERARSFLDEDAEYVQELLQRLNTYTTDDEAELLVHRMMACLTAQEDRHLFVMYLRGASLSVIAGTLHIEDDTCRHRWRKIRKTLQERFREGVLDG